MKFPLILSICISKLNAGFCSDYDTAQSTLNKKFPELKKCLPAGIFFATPRSACGECLPIILRASKYFQSQCKLHPSSVDYKNKVSLYTFTNWSNQINIKTVCHKEEVYEKGKLKYDYLCVEALMKADTVIMNARAKIQAHSEGGFSKQPPPDEDIKLNKKDLSVVCNKCTLSMQAHFNAKPFELPLLYSYIPSSTPDKLFKSIKTLCSA